MHFYVFRGFDAQENKLGKNNIDLVAIFTLTVKHHQNNNGQTTAKFYRRKIFNGNCVNVRLSSKMCLLSCWPFIIVKKIILFPLKIFWILGNVLLVAYLSILLCAFCSKDGYQLIRRTCTIE